MNAESLNSALTARITKDFDLDEAEPSRIADHLRRAAGVIGHHSIGRTGMALEDAAESILSAYTGRPVDGGRVIDDVTDFLRNDGVAASNAPSLARRFVEAYAQSDCEPTGD